MSTSFRITPHPPRASDSESRWLIHVSQEGAGPVALAVSRVEDPQCALALEGDIVSSIALDLLRPGWAELAIPERDPVIAEGRLYRTFTLHRRSRFDEATWRVECLVEAVPGEDKGWSKIAPVLDALHRAANPESPSSHVG